MDNTRAIFDNNDITTIAIVAIGVIILLTIIIMGLILNNAINKNRDIPTRSIVNIGLSGIIGALVLLGATNYQGMEKILPIIGAAIGFFAGSRLTTSADTSLSNSPVSSAPPPSTKPESTAPASSTSK